MEFRPIVQRILEERYLRRSPEGEVIETPEELFWRVARSVAAAEVRYGGKKAAARQATQGDVARGFFLAHRLGLKGITVYRYGSRAGQVLSLPPEPLTLSHEFGEECRLRSV